MRRERSVRDTLLFFVCGLEDREMSAMETGLRRERGSGGMRDGTSGRGGGGG